MGWWWWELKKKCHELKKKGACQRGASLKNMVCKGGSPNNALKFGSDSI